MVSFKSVKLSIFFMECLVPVMRLKREVMNNGQKRWLQK